MADTPRANHEFREGLVGRARGECAVCGEFRSAHPRPEPAEREPFKCGCIMPGEAVCRIHEPAAGDPLGEMARDWLNSYSYPDHLNENMRGLLRAAFERLVREDAAVPLSMRCSEQPCPCFDCKVLEGVSDGILARYGLKEER